MSERAEPNPAENHLGDLREASEFSQSQSEDGRDPVKLGRTTTVELQYARPGGFLNPPVLRSRFRTDQKGQNEQAEPAQYAREPENDAPDRPESAVGAAASDVVVFGH